MNLDVILFLAIGLIGGFFIGRTVARRSSPGGRSAQPPGIQGVDYRGLQEQLDLALRDLSAAGERERSLVEALAAPPRVSHTTVPMEVTSAQQQQIANAKESAPQVALRFTQDTDVAVLFEVLCSWGMRRDDDHERDFEDSLHRSLKNRGLGSQVERQPRMRWIALESGGDRQVMPDLVFRNRVLCELKGDIRGSADADRALGQMLRYLLAWKLQGPAILVICGEIAPELRYLVRYYVATWREVLKLPVTVMFKQYDTTGT